MAPTASTWQTVSDQRSPQTPATPPGVPVPYPNTGMDSDTTDGSRTVQVSGNEFMLKNKSSFKSSMDAAPAFP